MFTQTDLFVAGTEGYHTFRIPAMVVSSRGSILAFCEGRKESSRDWGEIHVVLKRSLDGGETWQDLQVLVTDGDMTCGNPCPVVDQSDGTIWLPFCKNTHDGNELQIMSGTAPRTVWMTRSIDDGVTWAEPVEITRDVEAPNWTWVGTGPTHGIQLANGRLVIPTHHVPGRNFDRHDPQRSHVMYSDDHGATWHIGGVVVDGTGESAIVQTADGSIYINCRNLVGEKRRGVAWSRDNGDTFGEFRWEDALVEPICQGSLVRFTEETHHDRNRVLFANPASTKRERMTVRLSYDECLTWNEGKVVHPGPSAYSDLGVLPDLTVCCLYERGDERPYEKITLARFDAEWLTGERITRPAPAS